MFLKGESFLFVPWVLMNGGLWVLNMLGFVCGLFHFCVVYDVSNRVRVCSKVAFLFYEATEWCEIWGLKVLYVFCWVYCLRLTFLFKF